MTTPSDLLTIQQAAAHTGLTVHTLRYYERIGLLLPVGRATNGHRRYAPLDLQRIKLLNRLRATGMPISEMQRYAQLLQQGSETIEERRVMLEEHRGSVIAAINDLQEALELIDFKISQYREIENQMLSEPGDIVSQ